MKMGFAALSPSYVLAEIAERHHPLDRAEDHRCTLGPVGQIEAVVQRYLGTNSAV